MKTLWERCAKVGARDGGECRDVICRYVAENDVMERILHRVARELETAYVIADDVGLGGLADDFRCLGMPLIKKRTSFGSTGMT
jgi:hypothetical protein